MKLAHIIHFVIHIIGLIMGCGAMLFSARLLAEEHNRVVTFVALEDCCDVNQWPEVEKALQRELQKTSFIVRRASRWRKEMDGPPQTTDFFWVDVHAVKNTQTHEGTIEIRFYHTGAPPRIVVLQQFETLTQEAPMVAALRVMELIQSEEEQYRSFYAMQHTAESQPQESKTSLNDTIVEDTKAPPVRWGVGIGFSGFIPFSASIYRAGPALLVTLYIKSYFFSELSGRAGFFGNSISEQGHSTSLHLYNIRVLGGVRFRSSKRLQPQLGVFGGWLRAAVQGDNNDPTLPAREGISDAFQIGLEPGLRLQISRLLYGVVGTGISFVTPKANIEIEDAVVASIGHVIMDCSLSMQIIF